MMNWNVMACLKALTLPDDRQDRAKRASADRTRGDRKEDRIADAGSGEDGCNRNGHDAELQHDFFVYANLPHTVVCVVPTLRQQLAANASLKFLDQ
jgi:hypothetical protein